MVTARRLSSNPHFGSTCVPPRRAGLVQVQRQRQAQAHGSCGVGMCTRARAPTLSLPSRTPFSCDLDETKPTMLGDVGLEMSITVSESEFQLATNACEPLTVTPVACKRARGRMQESRGCLAVAHGHVGSRRLSAREPMPARRPTPDPHHGSMCMATPRGPGAGTRAGAGVQAHGHGHGHVHACQCVDPLPSSRTQLSCDDDGTKPTILGDVGSAMSSTVNPETLVTNACEPLTATLRACTRGCA